MAKKASGTIGGASSTSPQSEKPAENRLLFGDNLKWLRVAKIFPDACDWHASHYVKVMLDQIFGENNFSNVGCIV